VFVCPVSRLLSEAVNLGAELVDADRGREAHARVPLRTSAPRLLGCHEEKEIDMT
jgi:hypothetical protein